VSWRGPDGKAIKADAVARQVNARGGFLEMELLPEFGSRISLTNFLSARTVEARVLATPQTRAGVSNGVAIELVVPNEEFWGVDLQAKKTAVELRKLEAALGSQGVDLRLLSEFRDAVEYIRGVTTVAQHLREVQLRGRDDNDLHAEIAAERVRRTTKLCREIAADLDVASAKVDSRVKNSANGTANSAGPDSNQLDELRQAIAQVADRLKRLEPLPVPALDSRPASRQGPSGVVIARNLISRS
jgi:hypothetical protein